MLIMTSAEAVNKLSAEEQSQLIKSSVLVSLRGFLAGAPAALETTNKIMAAIVEEKPLSEMQYLVANEVFQMLYTVFFAWNTFLINDYTGLDYDAVHALIQLVFEENGDTVIEMLETVGVSQDILDGMLRSSMEAAGEGEE